MSPVAFDRSPWGLVAVTGADATTFLQSLVSQDLDPVAEGHTVAALLLQPQGKLDVAFRATRTPDGWWLDTDAGFGPRLAESLARYKIRVKVDLDDCTEATGLVSVVGATPADLEVADLEVTDLEVSAPLVAVATDWGGVPGCDILGPLDAVRAWLAGAGLAAGTPEELEVLRIAAGVPRLGVDIDERTIPQEAFLERDAVSFTKGCFIGQELVCRIDTRGHVNRHLRRLRVPGASTPPVGAEVVVDGKVVGEVTSAATADADHAVALAMVRHEVEPPATVALRWGGHEAPATLIA